MADFSKRPEVTVDTMVRTPAILLGDPLFPRDTLLPCAVPSYESIFRLCLRKLCLVVDSLRCIDCWFSHFFLSFVM